MKTIIFITIIFNYLSKFSPVLCANSYECKEVKEVGEYNSCEIKNFEPGRETYTFYSSKHPNFINKVTFRQSKYQEIPSVVFHLFKNITTLNLNEMSIDHIDPNNIGDASSLKHLFMMSNKITVLKNESLSDAPQLETLFLSKNQIKDVGIDAFKGLYELRVLALDGNRIEIIHNGTFESNTKLNRIDLGNNYLKEVDTLLFFPCKKLKELILNKNRLTILRLVFESNFLMKLIANHNYIETLWLDAEIASSKNVSTIIQAIENKIETFFVSNKYKVTALHLYKNKLSDFSSIWRLSTLKSLSLSSNSIGYVDRSSFEYMEQLEDLYLSRTDLFFSDPDTFSGLKNLKKLDIGYNNLRFIDFNDFRPMKKLEDLAIHSNGLTDINVHLLKSSIPSLKRIFISGNNFLCDVLERIVEHLDRVGIQPTGDFKTLTKVDASKIHCNPNQDSGADIINTRELMFYYEGKISSLMKVMENRMKEQYAKISEKFCHLETIISDSKSNSRNQKLIESVLCRDTGDD